MGELGKNIFILFRKFSPIQLSLRITRWDNSVANVFLFNQSGFYFWRRIQLPFSSHLSSVFKGKGTSEKPGFFEKFLGNKFLSRKAYIDVRAREKISGKDGFSEVPKVVAFRDPPYRLLVRRVSSTSAASTSRVSSASTSRLSSTFLNTLTLAATISNFIFSFAAKFFRRASGTL